MKTRISVTAADIAQGKVGDCGECPVALAMGRAFPGRRILADSYGLNVDDRQFPTPPMVDRFMQDFDRRRLVEPFTFEIDA